ncbi:isoprenylcysteine carboxyl methyltransferase family protein [Cellulomonas cellasea]|uniref:isoprenylcysteine carboxyl methyltransferase family protein n=1 Tax=Cellulomonas cellasea TaxID=43670 RepID=UPI0025A34EFD|nr:isoprenylcysteine carboxyl methyltransferase family protein [Cellulomonas cellasea]MDM8084302.1 isoprenylcysteine carboxyl methyltransferase family protein [Cellulomonas cellasea]
MSTLTLFTLLVAAVAAERLVELAVAQRNASWAFAHGGVESGRGHYPAMVALHTGLLGACVAEAFWSGRPFDPRWGLVALAAVLASQALRWWCVATLGPRWNTRIIVVPGLALVARGPYRWLRHPNYVAVALEGAALPLVHSAWLTAVAFTVLNAVLLLRFRIPAEERALALAPASPTTPAPSGSRGGGQSPAGS